MKELKFIDIRKINLFITFTPLIIIVIVIFLVMMIIGSSTENAPNISTRTASDGFSAPFKDGVPYYITSEFGMRVDPINHHQDLHSGIDLKAPDGTEIVASAKGKVYQVSLNKDSLGNFVMLEHDVDGVKYYTGYGHMKNDSIVVQVGQEVEAKQKLGIIGMTGRATGVHVHFTLMSPQPIWKLPYLKNPKYIIEISNE